MEGACKMIKRKSALILTVLLLLSSLAPTVSFAQNSSQNVSEQDIALIIKIQKTIQENISFDKNEMTYYIKNEEQLKDELSNYKEVSYDKVIASVDQINSILSGEEGKEAQEEFISAMNTLEEEVSSKNEGTITTLDAACNAYTAIAYAHPTAVGGLATAAQVSGPIGWGVAAGMGALYLAGGYFVC